MNDYIVNEVSVRTRYGMQLSEGYIRTDNSKGFLGCMVGLVPCFGKTLEEVRIHLEQEAQEYYGDDVVVEIFPGHAVAS